MMFNYLFVINLACSLIMVGVIGFVQVVHYPSFLKVAKDNFQSCHSFHVSRTGLIVIPFMLAELFTSFMLSVGDFPLSYIHQIGLVLVAFIWLSTFAIQMRLHRQINSGNDKHLKNLVKTNWIRTILWSFKGFITLYGLKLLLQ